MKITIGKRVDIEVGRTLYYQDSMGTKAYLVVSDVDGGIYNLRYATGWEILKFKMLLPWRRLKRWALDNREEM